MAESVNSHEYLDNLAEEYVKAEHSKQIDKTVEFYQTMAEKDTRKASFWAIAIPGIGHFPLRRYLEGFCFLLLEVILTGTILTLFFKSIIAIFTDDPDYWNALLWCLGGAIAFRIVSLVRVVLLANKIKSDAAYLMLRLADKKPEASA